MPMFVYCNFLYLIRRPPYRTRREVSAASDVYKSLIYHSVGTAWVGRRVLNSGKALGLNGAFGSIGVGLAPILAAVLTDFWSWRAAFILPGIISILIGCTLAFMFNRGKITDGETVSNKEPSEATENEMKRGVLLLLITVACTGLIYQATSFALPKLIELRLSGILGEGLIGVGAIVSIIYFVSGGAQLVGGWLLYTADAADDLVRVVLGVGRSTSIFNFGSLVTMFP